MCVPVHMYMIPPSCQIQWTRDKWYTYNVYIQKNTLHTIARYHWSKVKHHWKNFLDVSCSWSVGQFEVSKSEFKTKSRANESKLWSETPLVRLGSWVDDQQSHSLSLVPTVNVDAEADFGSRFWQYIEVERVGQTWIGILVCTYILFWM